IRGECCSFFYDGWAYVATGQYLWDYPRGTHAGLSPLYQFADTLAEHRHISFSLLGFFSPLVRAGQTYAVSTLFQAWALFAVTCAVALYWVAGGQRTGRAAAVTVLSTLAGWMTTLVWCNNFDNTLALAYMPALGAVLQCLEPRRWRWWLLVGGLLAGILY